MVRWCRVFALLGLLVWVWGGLVLGQGEVPGVPGDTYRLFVSGWEDRGTVTVDPSGDLFEDLGLHSYPDTEPPPVVTVTAVEDPGFAFVRWEIGPVGQERASHTEPEQTITMTDGQRQWEAHAVFARLHTLTMGVAQKGAGTTIPQVGEHLYEEGSEVQITAMPEEGLQFVHWEGDVTDPDALTTTVSMDADKTVTAHFVQPHRRLRIYSPVGQGTVAPAPGTYHYPEDAIVDLVATPADGWEFSRWQGAVDDPHSAETTVTMDRNKTLIAYFDEEVPRFSLTVEVDGQGTTVPALGTHTYAVGSTVNVAAFPDDDWEFSHWDGEVDDPQARFSTVMIGDDTTVCAVFTLRQHTISATAGVGGTISPQGEIHVDPGTTKTFSIVADEGYAVDDVVVDGELAGPVSSYTFDDVAGDHVIHALFRAPRASRSFGEGWHLISVPASPGDPHPEAVFASIRDMGWALAIYEWAPGHSFRVPTAVDPGRGYWLHLWDDLRIEVSGVMPTGTYPVALETAGWHIVSTPRWPVRWEMAVFADAAQTKGLAEAISADWVEPYAFYYDPEEEDYRAIALRGTTGAMDPWTGYWLKTRVPGLTFVVPVSKPWTPSTSSSTVALHPTELSVDLQPPVPPRRWGKGPVQLHVDAYPNPVVGGLATFRVAGHAADGVRVHVLDLGGRKVWEADGPGGTLNWNLVDAVGKPVANGVYLYIAEVRIAGRWLPAGFDRLLVTR